QLEIIVCGADCIGDINNDGTVNVTDVLAIIGDWNTSNPETDLDGNGIVAVGDLLILIGNWGNCE
ncbi:MAG: dockerin type I domain-containing protein, partial [Phycisphaerales bacterium]|nr:dockerin type I domain-containing protein [Phycisphaerales bacterium]